MKSIRSIAIDCNVLVAAENERRASGKTIRVGSVRVKVHSDGLHCGPCRFYDFSNTMANQYERCILFKKNLHGERVGDEWEACRLEECLAEEFVP